MVLRGLRKRRRFVDRPRLEAAAQNQLKTRSLVVAATGWTVEKQMSVMASKP
jgi:hypothetical protein